MPTTVEKCHLQNAIAAGNKNNVAPADILAILEVEGGTDKNCRPVAPGDGLGPPSYGQFITATGKALGVQYGNSASETDAIARYLNELGYQDNRILSFAKYNGGPGNPQHTYSLKVDFAARKYKKHNGKVETPRQPGPLNDALEGAEDVAGAVGDTASVVANTLEKLFGPDAENTWKRVAFVFGGGVALTLGAIILANEFLAKVPTPVSQVMKGVKK